jgi:multiple sugar transport system substrate-binding protein
MHTGESLKDRHMVISLDNKLVEAKPLTDADYQCVLNSLSSLNTLQYTDPNVMNILSEELPTFFTGQKSAEEVASLIQNRVNTLLNE